MSKAPLIGLTLKDSAHYDDPEREVMSNNCPNCYTLMTDDSPAFKQVEGTQDGEYYFCEAQALAVLLANGVVFVTHPWWQKDWPEAAREFPMLMVNCYGVFDVVWDLVCPDNEILPAGEMLPYIEIASLWAMWRKDSSWGPAVWCMQRRKQMPQQLIEGIIREARIWDLDSMGLRPNRENGNV